MNIHKKVPFVRIPQDTTTSLADDQRIRYMAQSYLTRCGFIPELPTIEEAREILAGVKRATQK